MDNITHSLIGIAAAEPFALRRAARDRIPLWIASAVANNLPDLDVLFTSGHDRLTSLLHHRGFTHTLLLGPLEGMLWLAVLRLWWRRRTDLPWAMIALLCLGGPLLHILADSWNTYGVHPFWPFDNQWYYGDLIFIVEPWIWAMLLPILWARTTTRLGKSLVGLIWALMAGLLLYHPYARGPASFVLLALGALWFLAQRWIPGAGRRLALATTGLVLLFSAFGASSWQLRRAFAAEGTAVAALPSPANPFCWTILAAGFRGDQYRAAAWTASSWPALVPAKACAPFLRGASELSPSAEPSTPARIPLGAFFGTRAEFSRIVHNCRARAYLRFARIPVWRFHGDGFQLGDLRFGGGLNFAELSGSSEDSACPRFEPPWEGRFFPSS